MRNFVAAALLLTFVLPAAAQTKRVIISTDLAIGVSGGWRARNDPDDGWAVAMALADRTLKTTAIVTVLGNSNVAPQQIAAEHLIRNVLGRRDVVLAQGAAVKLDNPQAMLGTRPLTRDCWNHGVQAMADELKRGAATIIAIGPLTDVACLAMNDAGAARNITEVIAIMGRAPKQSFAIGKHSGLTDFNLASDDRSTQVLLDQTTIPMTFLQFSLTKSSLISIATVKSLNGGGKVKQFFHDTTLPWAEWWSGVFAEGGFHPWDSNAVYYAGHPSAFACSAVQYQFVSCADGSTPYNRNPQCAGHSLTPPQPSSLDREAVQVWLAPGLSKSRTVKTCTAYASPAAKQAFEKAAAGFF
jgi:pyrimidine-specific ribonucleoside hydrolase